MGEVLGVARKAEPGVVKRLLGNRTGDHRRRLARDRQFNRPVDGFNRARSVLDLRSARCFAMAVLKREYGKRVRKDICGIAVAALHKAKVKSETLGAQGNLGGICNKQERRQIKICPSRKSRKHDIRTYAGRIADCERENHRLKLQRRTI